MNKDNMIQGSLGLNDTLAVMISFYDADGDLDQKINNIVVTDNRVNEVHVTNTLPQLPHTSNGNVGNFTLFIPTLCCVFDDGTPACESPDKHPTNELIFDIFIIDGAGNESNHIQTPSITLHCN